MDRPAMRAARRLLATTSVAALLLASVAPRAVGADSFEAVKTAAERGDLTAEYRLAQMYERGEGTCRDPGLAYAAYIEAYRYGQGVPGALGDAMRIAPQMNGQGQPNEPSSALAGRAALAAAEARRWRADARLMTIEFRSHDPYAILFSFKSASAGTGLWLRDKCGVGPFEASEAGPVGWGDAALPETFVELTRAIETARRSGLRGDVDDAVLAMWYPRADTPVAAWIITASGTQATPIYIADAATGAPLKVSQVLTPVATDRQLAAAAKPLRDALAPRAPAAAAAGAAARSPFDQCMMSAPALCSLRIRQVLQQGGIH